MGNLFKALFPNKANRIQGEQISQKASEKENRVIKIHICGLGERKAKIIEQFFKSKISQEKFKSKGDNEFKTNDFYWIIKKYNDEILDDKKCGELEDSIEKDCVKDDNGISIKHHILLLFGDDNDIQMVVQTFSDAYRPRIIFITEKKKEFKKFKNQKFVKNIICEGLEEQELNNLIISSLWELDCYYNEEGNEIERYSPKNISKALQTDNSFFSINILLTGMCRSGKSTFINLLSEKLIALEANDSESVTLKISDYFIVRNDSKKEHGVIKIIDTPGLCDKPEINNKVLAQMKELMDNKEQKIEKQIHFILFFFMEQSPLLNSDELLKVLNDSDYPVFFIINKSHDKSWKGTKSQDIKSKIKYLKNNNFNRLAVEDNFIQVNIKSTNDIIQDFYGMDDIFKKIEQYIKDNNLLDRNKKKKMESIQKNFQKNLLCKSQYNNNKIDDNKENIDKIYNDLSKNLFFKNMTLDNMKKHGRYIASKYEKNIILLSNLKSVFPEVFNGIPITAFLQSFLIKEIGAGYGFDFSNITYCFKKFYNDINKFELNNSEIKNIFNEKEKEPNKIYNKNYIEVNKDKLLSKIEEIWENSNEEVIKKLSELIIELTKYNDNNKDKDKDKINKNNEISDMFIENTKAISLLCQKYFEEELDSSNGIPFVIYFFKKIEMLMENIHYFEEKKDWEKDEIEIIEKKINNENL